jgi:N-acetylmuramoyl-L-alanine amidase
MEMKNVQFITLHCSATRPSMQVGAKDIRAWHKAKGWADIGYHFVIKRDGTVEKGRPLTQTGAHVAGWNQNNIGICLVGGIGAESWAPENNFTREQWRALKPLVAQLRPKTAGGKAKVVGHRDFPNVHKACPCFEAKAWAKNNGFG